MFWTFFPTISITPKSSSPGPLWALRIPDFRSAAHLFSHLHVLSGARDPGKDIRPDRSQLQSALGGQHDGYGHGAEQAQHRAGLSGG